MQIRTPGRLAYGMFERHHLVGVAVLGEPMHPRVITKPLPTLTNRTGAELSRVVLLNEVPANAESWFVRRVLRDAATHGLRGVVAFSDPMPRPAVGMPGHVGDFYRALGLSYCGRATRRTLTFLPDGTVFPIGIRTGSRRPPETGEWAVRQVRVTERLRRA